MNARLALLCAICICCGCDSKQPSLNAADVQQFVRDYVAANNSADSTKVMAMVLRAGAASSISGGEINRGWEAMGTSTAASVERRRGKLVLGAIEVTPLAPDAAVAVGTVDVQGIYQVGNMVVDNLPGAFTIVVKQTPEGLRLVHEHYSIRARIAK
jgi:ketosteroid isomerase-like protein